MLATVAGRKHGVKSGFPAFAALGSDAGYGRFYVKRTTRRATGKYAGVRTNGVLRRHPDVMTLDAMLTTVDPYRVLQVLPDAEPEVIQAAYRALARKHHPDVGGSELQMAMLNAAWETLRNAADRARYDLDRRTDEAQRTRAEQPPVDRWTFATAPLPRATSSRARAGTVLDYGRYAGFSLGELAVQDRNYLEWLARTPMGRRLQQEIEALLTPLRSAASRPATPRKVRGRSSFLGRR